MFQIQVNAAAANQLQKSQEVLVTEGFQRGGGGTGVGPESFYHVSVFINTHLSTAEAS